MQWGWSHDPQHQQQPAPLPHTSSVNVNVTDTNAHDSGPFISEPQFMTMAPVQLEPEFSYTQVATVVAHVLAATYLTFEVGRSLQRAYRGLGPSRDTRQRISRRNALVPGFAGLALISLGRAFYTTVEYATLSYQVWASQQDVELPLKFYGDHGVFPHGENSTPIYPFQWLSDTPVHLDAIEILAEKARRFWWGQQFDLSLISWTMLLAIEGRRRNIPLLWSYQLLGQLVSLSFAQNLFFVALLLTPAPLSLHDDGSLPLSRYVQLRNRIFPPKPKNWTPHYIFFTFILGLYPALVLYLPRSVNTPYLGYLVLSIRATSLLPLVLPYIVPTSLGTTYTHPHDAYATYKRIFTITSAFSCLLHANALIRGLLYNAPDAHYHRHSIYLPFDTETRSAWEQASSAFGRVLGAMSDHPVVSGIGWDVILSAVSVGCWAAARATEVSDILASSIPAYHGQDRISEERALGEPGEQKVTTRAKAKALAASTNQSNAEETAGPRRRGRPRKVKSEPDDKTYEPTPSELAETDEGDELPDGGLDWESAAVVWGLTALGGLGVGSAGAFGGECVAR
ncbi:Fc.00g112390.m01.CDS01 [Cosmosporella sp. VM-42]